MHGSDTTHCQDDDDDDDDTERDEVIAVDTRSIYIYTLLHRKIVLFVLEREQYDDKHAYDDTTPEEIARRTGTRRYRIC